MTRFQAAEPALNNETEIATEEASLSEEVLDALFCENVSQELVKMKDLQHALRAGGSSPCAKSVLDQKV